MRLFLLLFFHARSEWQQWENWSDCSAAFCGKGVRTRIRDCRRDIFGLNSCSRDGKIQEEACNTHLKECTHNWAQWEVWSQCDVTCGEGIHLTTRSCKDIKSDEIAANPRNLCEGEESRTKECANLRPCPEWAFWQDWTNCPVTCRDPMGLRASQVRRRECLHGPVGSGTCSRGDEVEDQFCATNPCPRWNFWTQWSECSVTCGNGIKTRARSCDHGEIGQNGCTGDTNAEMFCATNIRCPSFTSWSQWSICSQSCLGGRRSRTRECESPDNITLECEGESAEEESCATGPCPYWAEWGEWGGCSVECGGGDYKRNRECIDGKVGDIGCSSLSLEEYKRQLDNAKATGSVSMSSQYANSFMSSIQANQIAKQIKIPEDENASDGSSQPTQPPQPVQPTQPPLADEEAKHCNTHLCPGEEPKQWAPWGQWADWSFCSKSCGGGQKYRYRACQAFTSDPENWKRKILDRNMCRDEDGEELADCNIQNCPIWSNWNQWSVCEAEKCLGKGSQFREKSCLGGKPGDNGCETDEEYRETRECVFKGCPHPAEWYGWSECSKTCGGGIRFRERPCLNGDPGEEGCEKEKLEERDSCKNQSCPKWSRWERWSSCSAECGKGHQRTRRICMDGHVGLDGCLGPFEKRKSCFPLCQKGGTCLPETQTCLCSDSLGWKALKKNDSCVRNQACSKCSRNAVCLENGAICKCLPGFSGNGENCKNVDECQKETHFCESPAQCVDTEGSYFCTCPRGFRLHEKRDEICVDIDECLEDLADCPEPELWKLAGRNIRDELDLYTSKCVNTFGSYECSCNANFHYEDGKAVCQPSAPALIGLGAEKKIIGVDACFANIFKNDISWQVPFTARGEQKIRFLKKPTLSIEAELRNVKKEDPKFMVFYFSELRVDEIPTDEEWSMTIGEIEIEDSHISVDTLAPQPLKEFFPVILTNKQCLQTINFNSQNLHYHHFSIIIGDEEQKSRTELAKLATNLLSISYSSEAIAQSFLLDIRDFNPDWVKEQREIFNEKNIFTQPGKKKYYALEVLFQAKTKNLTGEMQGLLDFTMSQENAFYLSYEHESKFGVIFGAFFFVLSLLIGVLIFTVVSICDQFREKLSQMVNQRRVYDSRKIFWLLLPMSFLLLNLIVIFIAALTADSSELVCTSSGTSWIYFVQLVFITALAVFMFFSTIFKLEMKNETITSILDYLIFLGGSIVTRVPTSYLLYFSYTRCLPPVTVFPSVYIAIYILFAAQNSILLIIEKDRLEEFFYEPVAEMKKFWKFYILAFSSFFLQIIFDTITLIISLADWWVAGSYESFNPKITRFDFSKNSTSLSDLLIPSRSIYQDHLQQAHPSALQEFSAGANERFGRRFESCFNFDYRGHAILTPFKCLNRLEIGYLGYIILQTFASCIIFWLLINRLQSEMKKEKVPLSNILQNLWNNRKSNYQKSF